MNGLWCMQVGLAGEEAIGEGGDEGDEQASGTLDLVRYALTHHCQPVGVGPAWR
jgi:hypothetical protein